MFGGLFGLSQLENCNSGHTVKMYKTSTPQNMTEYFLNDKLHLILSLYTLRYCIKPHIFNKRT